ncbi:MAG: hypothetical protein QXZ43_04785 [Candidatus Aenigmatarchaeota archaeon]
MGLKKLLENAIDWLFDKINNSVEIPESTENNEKQPLSCNLENCVEGKWNEETNCIGPIESKRSSLDEHFYYVSLMDDDIPTSFPFSD